MGATVMINNYSDAFSLIESIINENEEELVQDAGRKEEEEFLDVVKTNGLHQSGSNKKKSKPVNQSKKPEKNEDEEDETLDDEESEEVETPDESPSTINLSDAEDYDKFVDLLNQFRAAHSFSSKDIKQELTDYFQKLSSEEKRVLHVFIKGLIQVTLMDVRGKTAYSPSDLKFDIVKKGSVSSEKKKSQARKIDAKEKTKSKDLNQPIKIGESIQDKASILRVLFENK
jgi:hypothetical protein